MGACQGFTTRSRYTTAQGLPQQQRYTGQYCRMHTYNCFIALLTHNSCPHAMHNSCPHAMHNSCPHAMHNSCPHAMHNSLSSRRARLFQSAVRRHLYSKVHVCLGPYPTGHPSGGCRRHTQPTTGALTAREWKFGIP